MHIGVVSDIHSNKVALDAVLDDMPSVDKLVCCGDIVGYGPWPSECVETIREECDIVVQGNHDRDLEDPSFYFGHPMAHEGLLHSTEKLTDEQYEWVTSLPKQETVVDQYRVVHSHPTVEDKYVEPKDFPRMRPHLDEYDGIFLGHTHIQHKATIDEKLILNPGSVGQPRDKNSNAAYAVVDTEESTAELHRVSYDIEAVADAVEQQELPKSIGKRLFKGK